MGEENVLVSEKSFWRLFQEKDINFTNLKHVKENPVF